MINARDWGMNRSLAFLRAKTRYIIKKKLKTFLKLEKNNKNYKIKNYSTFENYKVALC